MSNDEYLASILPKLAAQMPYKWRVQSFSKHKPQAACVAYIDARDVMQRLDDVCVYGWSRDHKELKGHMFSGVGVVMPDGDTVWRWDCGVESNTEAEKGEASDSFKRAAVNWGVGRFLYDFDVKYLPANEAKTSSNWPYVVDSAGKRVYDLSAHIGLTTAPDDKQNVVDFFLKYNGLVREWARHIGAVKTGIVMSDLSRAAEAWFEMPEDVQRGLWISPTKGGVFTTEEREKIKSTEFRRSYYGEEK